MIQKLRANGIHELQASNTGFAKATLLGRVNDAHNIHFPGATRRTLRISTSTATSDRAILILCIKIYIYIYIHTKLLLTRKIE